MAADAVVGFLVTVDPLRVEAQLLKLVFGVVGSLFAVTAGVAALVEGHPYSFILVDVDLAKPVCR